MDTIGVVVGAGLKMLVIWGSCLVVSVPLMKVGIDAAYKIYKK